MHIYLTLYHLRGRKNGDDCYSRPARACRFTSVIINYITGVLGAGGGGAVPTRYAVCLGKISHESLKKGVFNHDNNHPRYSE